MKTLPAKFPELIEEIIAIFQSFQGVGKRTAERYVMEMLKWDEHKLIRLGENIAKLSHVITKCPECGNISSENKLCNICLSPYRDKTLICVVEEIPQIFPIENSGFFKGVYHVTGGKLSPVNGITADKLNIDTLLRRIKKYDVKEIILALSTDVEGQTTAVYISNFVKAENVKVTSLAKGIPVGAELSYADAATIGAALNGRIPL